MPSPNIINPSTFDIPDGQALLYAEIVNSSTVYKYKYKSQNEQEVIETTFENVLNALGVKVSDLPVLVYKSDLLERAEESYAPTTDELTFAVDSKAISKRFSRIASTKVDKFDFLTKLATLNSGTSGIVSSTITSSNNGAVDLDYAAANRWKIQVYSGTNTLIPKNFSDGAEAYVIVYGGVSVSWEAFEYGGNSDTSTGSNHFDKLIWVGGTAPRSVASLSNGFQLIKFFVVDNVVIGHLLIDSCYDEEGLLTDAAERAEASAAAAAADEAIVEDLVDQASTLMEQLN